MQKIRNKLLVYITLIIAIPFLIFATIAIFLVQSNYISKELEHFDRNIDNLSDELNQYLTYIETSSKFFTQNPSFSHHLLENNIESLQSFFAYRGDDIQHVYYADSNGEIVAAYPEKSQPINSFKNEAWFHKIKNNSYHKSYLIFYHKKSEPTILMVDTPMKSTEFEGVTVVEFAFDAVRDIIKSKEYNYSYFLVDSDGHIIYSNLATEYNPDFIKDEINNPSISAKEITFNDEDYYLTSSLLKNYPYTLISITPKKEFLQPVNKLKIEFIFWLLSAILSLYLIGYLTNRSIIQPIEKLVKETKKITTEGFPDMSNIEIKNKGELSELSEQFNKMLNTLKDRDDLLYQRRINLTSTLVDLLEVNDHYTAGHSYRVYKYSVLIATKLGLNNEHIKIIETSSLLHDIGKIGVPQHILNKNGKLTHDEYEIIKKHPCIGSHALSKIENFDLVRKTILHHHESYNGNGYPDKLKGEEIPLESRIISIADAFDAMTSDRPYRSGMSIDQAFNIILNESGEQFDPDLVKVFAKIYYEEKDSLIDIFNEQKADILPVLLT